MGIVTTKRGGARPGAGIAKDCTTVTRVRQVTIDDERANKARAIGGGNLSRGIRRAIDALPEVKKGERDGSQNHKRQRKAKRLGQQNC